MASDAKEAWVICPICCKSVLRSEEDARVLAVCGGEACGRSVVRNRLIVSHLCEACEIRKEDPDSDPDLFRCQDCGAKAQDPWFIPQTPPETYTGVRALSHEPTCRWASDLNGAKAAMPKFNHNVLGRWEDFSS